METASTLRERFEAKVLGEPNSGCHLWTGALHKFGYGRIYVGNYVDVAHRVAWELANGAIPDGLFVLHKCDTPACVRPDHLFLGTSADNNADMRTKGRAMVGVRHPAAKLSDDDLAAIKADRRLQREIAADFAVCRSTISNVKRGKYYGSMCHR